MVPCARDTFIILSPLIATSQQFWGWGLYWWLGANHRGFHLCVQHDIKTGGFIGKIKPPADNCYVKFAVASDVQPNTCNCQKQLQYLKMY